MCTDLSAQTQDKCSPGFIWDAKAKKCVSCVKPCDTGLPGACGRGVMNCEKDKPTCEVIVKPGERMEICNGEDDDCDGKVDEGYDKDQDGYTTCGGDCDDRNPNIHPDVAELCDGIDNNCNGTIDDGFKIGSICTVGKGVCARRGRRLCAPKKEGYICDAEPGPASKEVCDGLDNDCDGMVDNGLGELTCGEGACRIAVAACVKGKLNRCTPLKGGPELCGDNIDNDCDRKVDEDFKDLGKKCTVGKGICERKGDFVCSTDKLSLICNVEAGSPKEEICGNRLDDDCNGIVDDVKGLNEPCNNQLVGECFREGKTICDVPKGAIVCSAPVIKPKTEICDTKDNDCDGQVDEGVTNACGTCGELPFKVGDPCFVSKDDACSVGEWTCDDKKPGDLICSARYARSEGKLCIDDRNPCTKDSCQNGACVHTSLLDGTHCDDLDACTIADQCLNGKCAGGALLACDDQNPCTEDKCDVKLGCLYEEIGAGVPNVCGGCEELKFSEQEKCKLAHLKGVCAEGAYQCTPQNELACVQSIFSSTELCNGLDDDCNGKVDEGLGEISCGIGACHITIAKCSNGKMQTCEPATANAETCDNMGIDNDCNGVMDDIAGLDANCPLKVGTCIIPGKFECVKGNTNPVCVVAAKHYSKDDDRDGIPNYCERLALTSPKTYDAKLKGKTRLFAHAKTRSAMLPWAQVFDAFVTTSHSSDPYLLIAGKNATQKGLAVLRVNEIFGKGPISFRLCLANDVSGLKKIINTPQGKFYGASTKGYYTLKNLSHSLWSAPRAVCKIEAERMLHDETRPWSTSFSGKEKTCPIENIVAFASHPADEDTLVGGVVCDLTPSEKRRKRLGFGLDIIKLLPQSVEQRFIPLWESSKPIDSAVIFPLTNNNTTSWAVVALINDVNKTALCKENAGEWECMQSSLSDIKKSLLSLTKNNTEGPLLLASRDGSVYDLIFSEDNLMVKQKGAIRDEKHQVIDGIALPSKEGGMVVLGHDYFLTAVLPPSSGEFWSKKHTERYMPESIIDEVVSSSEVVFVNPHAFTLLPVKKYGGADLFAAFDILGGGKRIGTMGFFFWNENEPPRGNLADISFDGRYGTARIKMTDPDGDELMFDIHIQAKHGGSLDHWIDEVKNNVIYFSAKGETASTVGVWPIKLITEAVDAEGRGVISIAMIAQDGTVESIQELAR